MTLPVLTTSLPASVKLSSPVKVHKPWHNLRVRLVAWYSLLAGFSILSSDGLIYIQVQQSLQQQVDSSLQVSAIQARKNLDDEVDTPMFDPRKDSPILASLLNDAGVQIYLFSPDGELKESFGDSLLLSKSQGLQPGFSTLSYANGRWRTFTKEILTSNANRSGWLVVAQSLYPVDATLRSLLRRNLLRLPLLLAMVSLGGLFLANRALKPIGKMTRITEQIRDSGDLSQRIHSNGATDDELAQLATLFDEMLDSLQGTFEQQKRFTADASHELRTPLTALKGRLQVTLSQSRSVEAYEDALVGVEDEVDRLIRLSTDLLLLSRLEQDQAMAPLEPVDLDDLLPAIALQIQPLAELHQLKLSTDIAPSLRIQGSPDQLIRLFLNLLDNAVKHTPACGEVSLTATGNGHFVSVSVRDTGAGIAPEHLPHLFERFYRVEQSRSRVMGGTGLGLAIAQEIVHHHHGDISAQSQLGQGTTVMVRLPRSMS